MQVCGCKLFDDKGGAVERLVGASGGRPTEGIGPRRRGGHTCVSHEKYEPARVHYRGSRLAQKQANGPASWLPLGGTACQHFDLAASRGDAATVAAAAAAAADNDDDGN
eukprot:364781-Chlamydomonas_euryale.AAC.5